MAPLPFLLFCTFFVLLVFLRTWSVFFQKSLKGACISLIVASIMAKFDQILREHFEDILKQRFKGHKNSE